MTDTSGRDRPVSSQGQGFRWLVGLTAGTCALIGIGLAVHLGTGTTRVVDDAATALAAVGAAVSCSYAARRRDGLRWFWRLLAAACWAWSAAEVAWAFLELVLDRAEPFPSVADIGYAAAIPLAAAALLAFPGAFPRAAGRARSLLDGLIVSGSLLFVSWDLLLGPLYHSADSSPLAKALTLAYPLGDVLILSLVLVVMVQVRGSSAAPLAFVLCGLVAMAVADSLYAYLTQVDRYSTGSLIDVAWIAGYALLALGAQCPAGGPKRRPRRDAPSGLSMALPYFPFGLVLILVVADVARGAAVDHYLWVFGILLAAAVAIRQVVALIDNAALSRDLETKVAARTSELQLEREQFHSLVQHSSDLILVLDRLGTITYVGGSVGRVFGHVDVDLVGAKLRDMVHPAERAQLDALLVQATSLGDDRVLSLDWRLGPADGTWRSMETVITNRLSDPAVRGLVLNSRDVSERRRLEDQLRHQAFHDALTGLPNRALFQDRVEHAIARQARMPGNAAVLYLDLDDFKATNDTAGHTSGDQLLAQVAERLSRCVRPGDTVARLGGDEFAILVEGVEGNEDAVAVAARIQAALRDPVPVDGQLLSARASIGIAVCSVDGSSAVDLLRDADVAMYVAKSDGKGRSQVFEAEMHRALLDRLSLEADLAVALAQGQFALQYQPLVDLASDRWIGAEALLRWHHPTRGMVPPEQFIPVAERTGAIIEIGAWVLATACRQLASWRRRHPGLILAVNLSASQLRHAGLLEAVEEALDESGVPADQLVLEITESVLLDNSDATADALQKLASVGVRLSIDDFGTGYSSLSYLSRLPVHELKIDRSFVAALGNGGKDTAVVDAIVRLAHQLKLNIVAEGIEDDETAEILRGLGCEEGQGFLFARPQDPEDLELLLETGVKHASLPAR